MTSSNTQKEHAEESAEEAPGAKAHALLRRVLPALPEGTERRKAAASRIKGVVACATCAALLATGGALAYLTASDSATTRFQLDTNMAVKVTGAGWGDATGASLLPGQSVEKSPSIGNTGTVSSYLMARVKVPVFSGAVTAADGSKAQVSDQDLLSFALASGWTEAAEPVLAGGFRTYTYLYDSPVAGGAETSPLFTTLTLANLAEGIGATDAEVEVTGYGIQEHGFSSPSEAWDAYLKQNGTAALA